MALNMHLFLIHHIMQNKYNILYVYTTFEQNSSFNIKFDTMPYGRNCEKDKTNQENSLRINTINKK